MPALREELKGQFGIEAPIAQLDEELNECKGIVQTGKNHVRQYMITRGIWHISELDYGRRVDFEREIAGKYSPNTVCAYLRAFDQIKQHSLRKQFQIVPTGKSSMPVYQNALIFLPYHPDEEIVERVKNITRAKRALVWDFQQEAPEYMKRQFFHVLHYEIKHCEDKNRRREKLLSLRQFYDYCVQQEVQDIENFEIAQKKIYLDTLSTEREKSEASKCVEACRKALFMQADTIRWKAPVWYLERFHLQAERLNTSRPITQISFLEITHRGNRALAQRYLRYELGITNLSLLSICREYRFLRIFLVDLERTANGPIDVRQVTWQQMKNYLQALQDKPIRTDYYNDQIMAMLHFFSFLVVRGEVEQIPFDADLYLKKEILPHCDRSVAFSVQKEILSKLYRFPEEIRLMYLHLWAVGLRVSEVCSLKGDAYYRQGVDPWIQVYQIKMRTYKRIPIPEALYRLMQVYIKKHKIGAKDYVFQNKKGGAYCESTFSKKMKQSCRENHIQSDHYIFQSHDYRHSVATMFYDRGVSIQSIRDYLGHAYEEMTRQYIDYMPMRIAEANDEYYRTHKSLTSGLQSSKEEDG